MAGLKSRPSRSSTISNQQSAINNRQSAIGNEIRNPQSAFLNQSAIRNPQPALT